MVFCLLDRSAFITADFAPTVLWLAIGTLYHIAGCAILYHLVQMYYPVLGWTLWHHQLMHKSGQLSHMQTLGLPII